MGFLLLGIDSLIAGFAIGLMVTGHKRLALAAWFGVADGLAFLVGWGLGLNISGELMELMANAGLVLLGVYLVLVAMGTQRLRPGWPLWVVPVVLAVDNLAFGAASDTSTGALLGDAGSQAVSSALLALVGLLAAAAVARAVPKLRESVPVALGAAGVALVVAGGGMALMG